MERRELSMLLLTGAAGVAMMDRNAEAQSCTAPCYARTPAEVAAGVTPTDYSQMPGVVDRYGTNTSPGTTDMRAAIVSANSVWSSGGPPVSFQIGRYFVASNLTVSAPVVFSASAQLKPGTSVIITLNGAVSAPAVAIFILPTPPMGSFTPQIQGSLGGVDLLTRWFGDTPDGNYDTGTGTDNWPAFTQTLATAGARAQSFTAAPNRLITFAGVYACKSTVTVGSNIIWEGAGKYSTILYGPAANSFPNGLVAISGSGTYPTKFSGFAVIGQVNGSTGCGIASTKNGTFIEDVWVSAWSTTTSSIGIILNQTTNYLSDFVCELNNLGIEVGSQGSDITISNGETYRNATQGILIANGSSTDVGRTIVSHVRLYGDTQNGIAVSSGARHVTIQACSCQSDRTSDFNAGAFKVDSSNDVILNGCTAQVPAVGGGAGPGFNLNASTNIALSGCVASFMSMGVLGSSVTALNISGGIFAGNGGDGVQISGGDQVNIMGVSSHNNSGNGFNLNASTSASKLAVQCCMATSNNASGFLLTASASSFINCVGSTSASNTAAPITKSGTIANINVVGNF